MNVWHFFGVYWHDPISISTEVMWYMPLFIYFFKETLIWDTAQYHTSIGLCYLSRLSVPVERSWDRVLRVHRWWRLRSNTSRNKIICVNWVSSLFRVILHLPESASKFSRKKEIKPGTPSKYKKIFSISRRKLNLWREIVSSKKQILSPQPSRTYSKILSTRCLTAQQEISIFMEFINLLKEI